ncbi:MAG: 4-alpha-glucanotransferase [Bacteroidales bacterium]|nr:4-alpha-glucanotransferase [Bacteroidales bacterium]
MKTTFNIHYGTSWGESLSIVLKDKKYPMAWHDGGLWSVTVNVSSAALKDYWYVVIRDGVIVRSEWEHHSGTPAAVINDSWNDCPVPGCPFVRRHAAGLFDEPGFRGAGTAVPVFSLRSSEDFGIGDFRDLRPLVDWAAATGQSIIQLLPVGDTTRKGEWTDSYPYSPVSSFALHPLYLRLQEIGVEADEAFRREQAELNALPEIDYPRVFRAKMSHVRRAWEKTGAKDISCASFKRFCKSNAGWLDEYAEFCAQRDSTEPEYWRWIQWHLDRQFADEAAYARSRGVHFKGDLPIGVSADSADAFYHPELFNLDSCAGAPPDFFSRDGQNWGFPTYNWEEMAKDGYAWWKARLRKMSEYFDAFRIDHILGFFRIWEIPVEYRSGAMGHFNPAIPYSPEEIEAEGLPVEGLFLPDPRNPGRVQPRILPDSAKLSQWQHERFGAIYNDFFYRRNDALWRRNAELKLPELLDVTGMLACGEDLGMVPDCVGGVMAKETILSLEMENMDKGRPWPELAVCATSSHDMATLRMQFAADNGRDMEPWEVRRALMRHLDSAPMLAIFPLQDWLALDGRLRRSEYGAERINLPSEPNHHWCYRMHIGVEQVRDASSLKVEVAGMLKDTRRYNTKNRIL